ncbi:NAD-dependent epimerase/dehydratase family protein [Mucilaginibacter sp. CSA2-8R]|uniref:NAD-dependent epimerase/dehydratase family protein n=1 Tax=Mucilaginibacter sp. CSA2-8R TaxID=3141542 RepID=UPI00315D846B
MKILITGICGFAGSTLAKALLEANEGYEVFGIDNFIRSGTWLNKPVLEALGVKIFYGDIRQASDLEILPKADWVIDAAANPSVLAGFDGKTSSSQLIQHNLIGTINLLEYCKQHQAGFVLLSTSRVYSIPGLAELEMTVKNKAYFPQEGAAMPAGLSIKGVAENYSTQAPVSLYGCTKLVSEQLAIEYGLSFDFPVWVNRCGVMAGAGQFGHPGQGIFAYWIHSFKEKKPLKYIGFGGTGYQVRDCLHPRDLVSLLKAQFAEPLQSTKPRISNISGCTENSMSLAQLTDWCTGRFGEHEVIATNTERKFDIPWMVLDSSQAKEVWGWSPETPIEAVLEDIAAFAETQDKWCELSAS